VSCAIGGPVVTKGLVWIGMNNDRPLDPKVKGDCGVLACFRESDGKFRYQYASPRLENSPAAGDWPKQGQSGSPLIEGDRLWFRSNRAEVICMDIGPLQNGSGLPRVVWVVDLVKEYRVHPGGMMIAGHDTHGSIAGHKDYLYLSTGNGYGLDDQTIPSPNAPALLCLRKDNGKLVWKDHSPGKNIVYNHYSSPLVIDIKGTTQVIVPQGDGWVRAFDGPTGKVLWQFDFNRGRKVNGRTQRPEFGVATPVFAGDRVFVSFGRNPEGGLGGGKLFCLDPSKQGDISEEILNADGKVSPNPNDGRIWEFSKPDKMGDVGMHVTMSSVAVVDGLVIAVDHPGYIHCLDERTGKQHWSEDVKGAIFGWPLVVDGKVYVGTHEGDVFVMALSKTKRRIARHETERVIVAGPVFANGTLFLLTESRLYAIGAKK
jgi:outer membrane protein assembly factor BamB